MACEALHPVFVVCDTNVFVRETHLLRKKGGPQLIRLLGAVKGHLVVPDVCHQEYIEQTRLAAAEEHRQIRVSLSKLETLTGSVTALTLLEDPAVDRRTLARLEMLRALVHPVVQTKELLAAAGVRSLAKKRPASSTDPAYKDCLIWESLLTLPPGSEVWLVSKDLRAFFENGQFAAELEEEAHALGLRVRGVKDLGDVIQALQASNPTLDLAALSAHDLVEPSVEARVPDSALVGSESPPRTAIPHLPPPDSAEHQATLIGSRLGDAQQTVRAQEQRVFGYIAYLGDASKAQLFAALEQSGLAPAVAHNIAERLALVGLVQDTGHHYIVSDRELALAAASLVETDIIALLGRGR
jgi:hypothetical protein